jgi:DNA-binding transcriptional ArsR family regulator
MAPMLDTVFGALADPTRRAILAMLLEDDMAVSDVASAFPVSLAAFSKHLQVLAEAGLVTQESAGGSPGAGWSPTRCARPRPGWRGSG